MASTVIYKPGSEIAEKFRLEEKLGEGLTCQVYRAVRLADQQVVALKIMRQHLSENLRAGFEAEGIILVKLREAENQCGDGLQIVPEWFGHDLHAPTPWLAMELVDSQIYRRVPTILYESAQGKLDEPTGLTIGWQFCRVLEMLHSTIGKTYTDLKLDNIWWNPHARQIKVIDWNVVGTDQRGVTNDLTRLGTFLYRMLAGIMLEEHNGKFDTLERARGWHDLSYGTQEILRRILASARPERFTSAQELGVALHAQATLWEREGNQLLRDAAKLLEEDPDSLPTRRQAKLYLDLARRRPPILENVWNALWERVNARASEKSAQVLFQAGDYRAAREEFEEARKELEPAEPLRWWITLTDAALADRSKFEIIKSDSIDGVQDLQNQNLDGATEKFARAYAQCQLEPIGQLHQEAQLRAQVAQAFARQNQGQIDQAIQLFRVAHRQAGAIGLDQEWVQALGDLNGFAERLQARQKIIRLIDDGKALVAQGKWSAALDQWTDALQAHPSETQILSAWTDVASELLRSGEWENARIWLERALERGDTTPELRQLWQVIFGISTAQDLYFANRFEEAINQFHEIIARAPSVELVQRALEDLLEKIIARAFARKADVTLALEHLARQYQNTDAAVSGVWQKKLDEWNHLQTLRQNDQQRRAQNQSERYEQRMAFIRRRRAEREFHAVEQLFTNGETKLALERLRRYVAGVDKTDPKHTRAAELVARMLHSVRAEETIELMPRFEETISVLRLDTPDLRKEWSRLDTRVRQIQYLQQFAPLENAVQSKNYREICAQASRLLENYTGADRQPIEQILRRALEQMGPAARSEFAPALETILLQGSPQAASWLDELHAKLETARVENELGEIKYILNNSTSPLNVLEQGLFRVRQLAANPNHKTRIADQLRIPLLQAFNRSVDRFHRDVSHRLRYILEELFPEDVKLRHELDRGIEKQNRYYQALVNDTLDYATQLLEPTYKNKDARATSKLSAEGLDQLIHRLEIARGLLSSQDPRAQGLETLRAFAFEQRDQLESNQPTPVQRSGCLSIFSGLLSPATPPERMPGSAHSNQIHNPVSPEPAFDDSTRNEASQSDWVVQARNCLDRNPYRALRIVSQGKPATTRFPIEEQKNLEAQVQRRVSDWASVANKLKQLERMPIEKRRTAIATLQREKPQYPGWNRIMEQIETIAPEDW